MKYVVIVYLLLFVMTTGVPIKKNANLIADNTRVPPAFVAAEFPDVWRTCFPYIKDQTNWELCVYLEITGRTFQ